MDLRVRVAFSELRLVDPSQAAKIAARKIIKTEMKKAVKAGIIEMLLRVPVLTGMSVASLLPAGRYAAAAGLIRARLDAAAPNPRKSARIAEGESLGRPRNPAHTVTFSGDQIVINFGTNVPHFVFNDIKARNYPRGQVKTPWKAFAAAERAILKSLTGSGIRGVLIDSLDDILGPLRKAKRRRRR